MNSEEKLNPEEISKRIVTGMGMVYDLFNELSVFFRSVLDGLQSSDLDFLPITQRFILPNPKTRKLRTAADDYVKMDMGFIAEIGAGGMEDEEISEDEEESEAEIEKKGIEITPDSQFLAVRAVLYDKEKLTAGSFDPTLIAAAISSVKRSPRKKGEAEIKKEKKFIIKKSGHILRCMGQIETSLEQGKEIEWLIPKYKLSATIMGVMKRRIVDFDTEEKFNDYIEELIAMVENS